MIMIMIEYWNGGGWITPKVALVTPHDEKHELCNRMARENPSTIYRVVEDGQPPVIYADIERRQKTKINW